MLAALLILAWLVMGVVFARLCAAAPHDPYDPCDEEHC